MPVLAFVLAPDGCRDAHAEGLGQGDAGEHQRHRSRGMRWVRPGRLRTTVQPAREGVPWMPLGASTAGPPPAILGRQPGQGVVGLLGGVRLGPSPPKVTNTLWTAQGAEWHARTWQARGTPVDDDGSHAAPGRRRRWWSKGLTLQPFTTFTGWSGQRTPSR